MNLYRHSHRGLIQDSMAYWQRTREMTETQQCRTGLAGVMAGERRKAAKASARSNGRMKARRGPLDDDLGRAAKQRQISNQLGSRNPPSRRPRVMRRVCSRCPGFSSTPRARMTVTARGRHAQLEALTLLAEGPMAGSLTSAWAENGNESRRGRCKWRSAGIRHGGDRFRVDGDRLNRDASHKPHSPHSTSLP